MTRNYNTQNGTPYPRIVDVRISYNEAQDGHVTYTEGAALTDNQGFARMLSNTSLSTHEFDISSSETTPFQAYNPVTGEAVPGLFFTPVQIKLAIYAALHHHQLERDAEL